MSSIARHSWKTPESFGDFLSHILEGKIGLLARGGSRGLNTEENQQEIRIWGRNQWKNRGGMDRHVAKRHTALKTFVQCTISVQCTHVLLNKIKTRGWDMKETVFV